ncbi:MAG TPA: peptidoglycan DD-metalloendopeptidase family protein [Armatimonadota bacterium]|nr:peptidoglycan DD-metalloendopeptidase family protein [Armatimonadota bacterium]
MRPPNEASTTKKILCGVLLCSLFFSSTALPLSAARVSKKQLKQRKISIQTKIGAVKEKLHVVKAQEHQTRVQLHGVEYRVRVARGQLQQATHRLKQAQSELQHADTILDSAKRTYSLSQQEVGNRLVAAYERGNQGYLELLLSARDFGDLLERMQLAAFMRDQDRHALQDLKAHKDRLAKYQRQVRGKTREVAIWRQQVSLLNERTQQEHYQVAENLHQVKSTRADYEAEYAALMRDSAEITAMLQRMQQTPAGRKRYTRVYAGPVSGLPTNGRITSTFGYRIHPITHTRRMHTGLDIAAPIGTPVFSAGGGEVIFAGRRGGYGNAVIIDHGHGKTTLYGHMSAIMVRVGQVVSRRQQIGRVGSTGFSTGPHLHYEVRINGAPVNPL